MPKDPAKMRCVSSNVKPPFKNGCKIAAFPPYSSGCSGLQCICHQTACRGVGCMPFVAIPLVTMQIITSSCVVFCNYYF